MVKDSTTDHDLLIELKSEMVGLRADVKDLKDGTKERIRDHEVRLRFIERYMWLAIGALGLIEFGLQIYSNYK